MKDKHVQCIGADDKDGGEHEKSAWELHVWKMSIDRCEVISFLYSCPIRSLASGQPYCGRKMDGSDGNAVGHGSEMEFVSFIRGTDKL